MFYKLTSTPYASVAVLLIVCGISTSTNGLFERQNQAFILKANDDFVFRSGDAVPTTQTRNVFRAPLGFNALCRCDYMMYTRNNGLGAQSCLDDFFYFMAGENPSMYGATYVCGVGHIQLLSPTVSVASTSGRSGVSGIYICRVNVVPAIDFGGGAGLSSTSTSSTSTSTSVNPPTPANIGTIPPLPPIAPIATIPDDPAVVIT